MNRDQMEFERLLIRSLDGELVDDAELELNRALIRDPSLSRLREDYQAIDRLAAEALAGVKAGPAVDLNAVFTTPFPRQRSAWRWTRGRLLIPGAVAAALLAMFIPYPGGRSGVETVPLPAQYEIGSYGPGWAGSEFIRPVSTMPKVRSQTGREVIGVVGEDGNLYWIEVERTRTVRWPAGSSFQLDSGNSM